MKKIHNIVFRGQSGQSAGDTTKIRSVFHRLAVAMVVASITAAPVNMSLANEGFMLMQTEFELSKKPKFRQLNIGYQDTSTISTGFDPIQGYRRSIVIPLYSTAPGTSGLLNQLNDEVKQKEKVTLGQVVLTGLSIGAVGLYMYGIARCVQEAFEYDFNDTTVEEGRCR